MQNRVISITAAMVIVSIFGFVTDSKAQKYGGTLTLGMYSDIATADLHRRRGNPTAQMARLVAEGLADFDEQCEIVPSVAKSWKISPDAKEYTFNLRKGVMFHNGRELTAEDVQKSYEHNMDLKTRSPHRGFFKAIKRIEVVDKYTIKFSLKKPDASFFVGPAHPLMSLIIARESFEADPPHPIGTGPFEFVEWKPRQYVKLKRFKNYWKKDKNGNRLPYVDEVILKPIVDDTVRYTALRTGGVDWVFSLPAGQVPRLNKKAPEGITPLIKGGSRYFYLRLHTQNGATKDLRVRKAIAYAIDKNALMDGLTWGIASPESQPAFPGSQWYYKGIKDPYREADLAKAKELLKEAGYEKGLQLSTIVRNETSHLNLATLAQAQLMKVGIQLKLEILDRASHRVRQKKGTFEVDPGHYGYAPDPDYLYSRYLYSKNRGNYSRYNNPEFDKLMDEGRLTVDTAKRKEIYRKGLDILHRDVPLLHLGHLPVAQASRSYVKNMKTNCRGDTRWSDGGASYAWIEK